MKNFRVAVIGGGPTGLALGYFLGRAGYRVAIIEKGKELSGLLAFTRVNDVPIERFYHHFFTTDRYLLDLLDELGLHDKIIWNNSASAVYHGGNLFPFITKLDYVRLPFLSLQAKARAALAALRLKNQQSTELPPDLTAATYLRRMFGEEGWKKMWEPLLVNKFGQEGSRRISAQWVAQRIQTRAGSERRGREVLGYFKGSYRVVFDALRAAIERQGGRILLNTEVTELPPIPTGGYRIAGEEYDMVVSTIAPEFMKKIVPTLEVPSVTYRGAIVPLFHLRSAITPYYWINILDLDIPFSVIVNQQALLPAGYYHGTHPLYIGHYVAQSSELFAKSNEELYSYYLAHLKKIFPTIEQEIISYEISRTKVAQPIVTAPWHPLQHTTNLPNIYMTSMAHIFPEDRGVNFAIREAHRIVALLDGATDDAEQTGRAPETPVE